MIRVVVSSRLSRFLPAAACALALAGCIPTVPRLWPSAPPIDEAAPQVSLSAGSAEAEPEIMEVTAAPQPEVEVAEILAPPGQRGASASVAVDSAARPSGSEISVPAGKTLFAIAREHDVAVRDLIELNQLTPPFRLNAGQQLRLPTGRSYLVEPGDTLYGVARRLGVDLHLLVQRNALEPPYRVVAGTRLRLPSPSEPLAEPIEAKPTAHASAVAVASTPPKPIAKPTLQTTRQKTPDAARSTTAAAPAAARSSARLIAPPPRAGATFFWPVKGKVVSRFGKQGGGVQHDGIAIAVRRGTPVKASENGVVAYAGRDLKAYGALVLIRHADGWMTAYAYNEKLLVHEGDTVRRGQVIAHAGSSGSVSDPQTYFEIRHRGKPVDPLSHLTKS